MPNSRRIPIVIGLAALAVVVILASLLITRTGRSTAPAGRNTIEAPTAVPSAPDLSAGGSAPAYNGVIVVRFRDDTLTQVVSTAPLELRSKVDFDHWPEFSGQGWIIRLTQLSRFGNTNLVAATPGDPKAFRMMNFDFDQQRYEFVDAYLSLNQGSSWLWGGNIDDAPFKSRRTYEVALLYRDKTSSLTRIPLSWPLQQAVNVRNESQYGHEPTSPLPLV